MGDICLSLTVRSPIDELIDELVETEVLVSDHNEFAELIWEIRNQFKSGTGSQPVVSQCSPVIGMCLGVSIRWRSPRAEFPPFYHRDTMQHHETSVQKLEWELSLLSRRLMDERGRFRLALGRVLQETNFSRN